jgi:hypothetical protein
LTGWRGIGTNLTQAGLLNQGDQIGRIFFGQYFENHKSNPNFCAYFSEEEIISVLLLRKNGLGYILGDFFTNSSGHPGLFERRRKFEKLPISMLAVVLHDYQQVDNFWNETQSCLSERLKFIYLILTNMSKLTQD